MNSDLTMLTQRLFFSVHFSLRKFWWTIVYCRKKPVMSSGLFFKISSSILNYNCNTNLTVIKNGLWVFLIFLAAKFLFLFATGDLSFFPLLIAEWSAIAMATEQLLIKFGFCYYTYHKHFEFTSRTFYAQKGKKRLKSYTQFFFEKSHKLYSKMPYKIN